MSHNLHIPPVGLLFMLSVLDNPIRLCDGIDRREWLRVGAACGLALPALLAKPQAAHGNPESKAKACIQLFFLGAPPQQETWDPKPDSPAEVRGDLKPIQSAVPGMLVGELMPKVATLTGKIAVLRAVSTNDSAHSSSGYYMTTGVPHAPIGVENAKPGRRTTGRASAQSFANCGPRQRPCPRRSRCRKYRPTTVISHGPARTPAGLAARLIRGFSMVIRTRRNSKSPDSSRPRICRPCASINAELCSIRSIVISAGLIANIRAARDKLSISFLRPPRAEHSISKPKGRAFAIAMAARNSAKVVCWHAG